MEMHQDLSHSIHSPAELLTGCFDRIKVLFPSFLFLVTSNFRMDARKCSIEMKLYIMYILVSNVTVMIRKTEV